MKNQKIRQSKKSTVKKSLKLQITKWMLTVLIPIIFLLIYYNFYSIYTYNRELKISNSTILQMYSEKLENTLQKTDSFLATIVANDNNYAILRHKNKELNTHLALYNIETKFEGLLSSENMLYGLIAYSGYNNTFRMKTSRNYTSYNEQYELRSFFLKYTSEGANYAKDHWFSFKVNNQQYLMHIVGKDFTYVAAFIKLSNISKPDFEQEKGKYGIVLCDTKGGILYNDDFVEEKNLKLNVIDEETVTLHNSTYSLIAENIMGTSMFMCLLIPKLSKLNSIGSIQALLLIISIISIGLIPLSLIYIKKTVTNPLHSLTNIMLNIKDGNLDTKVDGSYSTKEFQDVNDTFSNMMIQIKDLKITAYEREIDKQKAQLQYFQLQLQPHFYLNFLKSIYGMAQNHDYEKIQELIIAVSNHLRYSFMDNSKLVMLGEEIKFVNNYLEIQSISSSLPPKCIMDMEPEVLDIYVPTLCIQTFIENSLKHGQPKDLQLIINLKITLLKTEEGDFVDIVIRDNGKGYEEEVLKSIIEHMNDVYVSNNVGIHNIISRLKLLYGEKAEFVIDNQAGGAYSELVIPVLENDKIKSSYNG